METQAPYTRQHVSECPLPEIPASAVFTASYVVHNPAQDLTDLLMSEAAALIADAGLPAMELTSRVTRRDNGTKTYWVCANNRVSFLVASVHVHGHSNNFDGCLRDLSANLQAWAMNAGLLPESAANAGEELALV